MHPAGHPATPCVLQVQRYWLLAKMCNDVIVHATTSGLFLYLSPKCKALLGYEPEQLTEEKLPSCVHPDDLRGLRDMLEAKKLATSAARSGDGSRNGSGSGNGSGNGSGGGSGGGANDRSAVGVAAGRELQAVRTAARDVSATTTATTTAKVVAKMVAGRAGSPGVPFAGMAEATAPPAAAESPA